MTLQTQVAKDLLHEIYDSGLVPTDESEAEIAAAYAERGEHRCDLLFPSDGEMREVYWVAYTLQAMLEQHRAMLEGIGSVLSEVGVDKVEIGGRTMDAVDPRAREVLDAALADLGAIITDMEEQAKASGAQPSNPQGDQ